MHLLDSNQDLGERGRKEGENLDEVLENTRTSYAPLSFLENLIQNLFVRSILFTENLIENLLRFSGRCHVTQEHSWSKPQFCRKSSLAGEYKHQ